MGVIEAIREQAEHLQLRVLEEDELPAWWNGVTWTGAPPVVLVSETRVSLECNGQQLAGVALRHTNEIAIFSDDFDLVLAHETAHFCQPVTHSSHGPMFLNQFSHLLSSAGFSCTEIEWELNMCVASNWWPLAPQWLRRRAVKEALKGGNMRRYESGLMRLCAIRQPGWRLALPVTAALGGAVLGGFLGGLLGGMAGAVTLAGLILL